jgi:RNA polymerase sigma factor (sigma-70 family)
MAPEDSESTLVLLDRIRNGDRIALDSLLSRHVPLLTRWASGRLPRAVRDLADTEDLVQESIIGAIRNVNHFEFRGEGAFQAYLRHAVMNCIRGEFRRRKRRPALLALREHVADDHDSPLDCAIGHEAVERYEAALAQLTDIEREAIIARVELALSYSEVAAALGKPTAAAARMAVNRALARLAHMMCP